MAPGPAQRVVQRPDGRYLILRQPLTQRLLVLVVFAACCRFLLLPDGSGDRLPLGIALPCCTLIGLGAWRVSSLHVELGPTVRITNFLRTLVLSWDEVVVFQCDDGGARVLLVDGRRPRISAFATGPRTLPYVERRAQDAVRQMENRRKSRLDNRRGRSGIRRTS